MTTRLIAFILGAATTALVAARAQPVDFNAQIRPILNQSCTSCHGGVKSAGDLSFVYREALSKVAKKSGRRVVVPGDPDASELIARVTSADKDYRMPPADHGAALPTEKIALLRAWIEQGAPWQDHWAFVPPKPQTMPVLEDAKLAGWARSPIDAFVAARLEREKLAPAPEAARAALLRRVSLDLTGLPPTPEEVAAFVADRAPGAYERQVDRLLASPHFGERWASLWLDLARYADTKGYEKDDHRTVWKYRDWVVDAFNRNLPYDRFVIEQLAGDLLPGATIDQHIATAFHRQTQVNDEGGTDDEEYRIAAVIDRVATTWQVTNAVTFNCVQCHSHPYDPIRHTEYYRFFALFNGTRDADFSNEFPTVRVPNDSTRNDDAWALRREVEALRREVVDAGRRVEAEAAQWRRLELMEARATPEAGVTLREGGLQADGTIAMNARYDLTLPLSALSLAPITALRFEAGPTDPEKAQHTPERGFVVSQIEFSLAYPDGSVVPLSVGRFFPDTDNFTTVATRTLPRARPAEAGPATAVAASGPGGAPAAGAGGVRAEPPETRDVTIDFHFAANPTISGPRWVVASFREPILAPAGATLRATIMHGRGITEKPAPIRRLRVAASADPRWNELARDADLARKASRVTEALAALAKIPGTDLPVLAELPNGREARQTRLFARGNFLDKTGEALVGGVPELFPKLAGGQPANRLTVAQWFFQPGQPLTARVAVNRFWEQLFGIGIVATLEDFGSVGDTPSHPELLDWLAVRFERELRWDMKALLRELVTSATYRQEAKIRAELLERDPQNRLLARGPRQRLTAEMVRDQALAASGLLSRTLGGPPVMPPQPAGVWQTVYNSKDWVESKGEDRYRRALYTFWKRSAAYPGFLSFDMPARDLCTARRTPTNTPLQALVTLNDVVYQDVAQALAARVLRETSDTPSVEARIERMFELVISRAPTPTETKRLRQLHDDSRAAVTALGTPGAAENAVPELRAFTDVAATVINLDAAFVR